MDPMGLRPETPCGKQKVTETLLLLEGALLRSVAVTEEEEEKRGGAPLVHGLVTENLLKNASRALALVPEPSERVSSSVVAFASCSGASGRLTCGCLCLHPHDHPHPCCLHWAADGRPWHRGRG